MCLKVDVHGIAHITGGGFDENIPRILGEGQGVEVTEGSWEILPVFRLLEKYGKVPHREMFNIFNMGIGMVLAVNEGRRSQSGRHPFKSRRKGICNRKSG